MSTIPQNAVSAEVVHKCVERRILNSYLREIRIQDHHSNEVLHVTEIFENDGVLFISVIPPTAKTE